MGWVNRDGILEEKGLELGCIKWVNLETPRGEEMTFEVGRSHEHRDRDA